MKCFLFFVLIVLTKEAQSVSEQCESTEDCKNTLNSKCFNNKCVCDEMSYVNADETVCLTYATAYKDLCYEDKQCTLYDDSFTCVNNKCVCKKGFRWYLGGCLEVADLNESCETDDNCFNGYDLHAMKCVGKVCTCSDSYYLREGGDCRKKLVDETSKCRLDIDCVQFKGEGYTCDAKGTCNKADSFKTENEEREDAYESQIKAVYLNDDTGFGNCTTDSDCGSYNNAECDTDTSTCKCTTGFTYMSGSCVAGFAVCTKSDCASYENTICFNKLTCICKKGYFLNKGICVPELGGKCDTPSDCGITSATCIDNKCYCSDYFFSTDTNRECVKSASQANANCQSNEWCKAFGLYSYCKKDGQGKCECNTGTTQNSQMYCEPPEDGVKVNCISDKDCGRHSTCINEDCVCDEHYSKVNEECVPTVEGSCFYEKCTVNASECIGGTCQCVGETTPSADYSLCLSITQNLGGPCEVTKQCYKFDNADCIDSKCECIDNYVEARNNCYENKTYNSYCTKHYECSYVLGDDFECRSSRCQCAIGKVFKNNKCMTASSERLTFSLTLLFVLGLLFEI